MVLAPPDQLRLQPPMSQIEQLCREYGVQELAVFGSVLRDDFRSDSDVDFLVVFLHNDAGSWACKYDELKNALAKVLGRDVDVADRGAIEKSENYLRRRHILQSARTIYVA